MNAAKAILKAREQVADAIGAKVNEIYFTSGGSEADNWAIRGSALNGAKKERNILLPLFLNIMLFFIRANFLKSKDMK